VTLFHQLTHNPLYSQPEPVPELAKATVASTVAIAPEMGLVAYQCGMPLDPRNIPNFKAANSHAPAQRLAIVGFGADPILEQPARSTFEEWRTAEPSLTLSSESVRHMRDPLWRERWLSSQRIRDWSAVDLLRQKRQPRPFDEKA